MCPYFDYQSLDRMCAVFFSSFLWRSFDFFSEFSPWKSVNNYAKTHSLSHSITIVLICSPSTISLFLFSHFFRARYDCGSLCVFVSLLVFHSTWIRSFFFSLSHFYRIPHCNANQFRKVTSTAQRIYIYWWNNFGCKNVRKKFISTQTS